MHGSLAEARPPGPPPLCPQPSLHPNLFPSQARPEWVGGLFCPSPTRSQGVLSPEHCAGRLCVLLAPSPHTLLSPPGENSIFEAFQKPFHQWQELLPAGQLTGLGLQHPFHALSHQRGMVWREGHPETSCPGTLAYVGHAFRGHPLLESPAPERQAKTCALLSPCPLPGLYSSYSPEREGVRSEQPHSRARAQ